MNKKRWEKIESLKLESGSHESLEKGACIEWTGTRCSFGYGIARHKGKPEKAHRLYFSKAFGPIPKGMFVCHKCDNPPCINLNHLFLGDAKDNNRDRHNKGRSRGLFPSGDLHPAKVRRGDNHRCTKLSSLDLSKIKKLYSNGLTQKQVAKKFLIHPASVSRIVRDQWRKVS